VISREEAQRIVDELPGAHVADIQTVAGVLIIWFRHRGTDDGSWRLAINLSGIAADPRGQA
jgi:hypothetical protein